MEKLQMKPHIRHRDYNAFLNELKLFHQNMGTPFQRLPRINGREINLLKLYNQVTALGGLQKVDDQRKWCRLADSLKLPKACANLFYALRKLYIRYLDNYEKIHFVSEEPANDESQFTESHRKQPTTLHSVPTFHNSVPNEVSDAARMASGLNKNVRNAADYDKLYSSLLSCLPNEQELALHVCTILSSEGNCTFNLRNCPKLVNLLLAQAGIWLTEDTVLGQRLLEGCDGLKGHGMERFWRSALNGSNPQIYELCNWILDTKNSDDGFFNLELDLGTLNREGKRVLRIAVILHNLSFEENNVSVLVSNPNFLRFAVLCMHTKYPELMQIAYDTVSNISSEIQLSIEKDACLRLFFKKVMDGILSPDRFLVIKSLDIFSKLCSCQANEDTIPSKINIEVYEKMVTLLMVPDSMLLFYTLEALYMLSDLGWYACEKIVGVHRSVSILVNLLTIDPNQHGSSAHFRMKLAETLVLAESDPEPAESATPITVSQSSTSTSTPVGTPTGDVDSQTFACNWLKSSYEYNAGSTIAKKEIYADYVSYCSQFGRHRVVKGNIFAHCVKTVFAHCRLKKADFSNGMFFSYAGLRKKKGTMSKTGCTSEKLANSCVTPLKKVLVPFSTGLKAPQKTNHSLVLKSQLSAHPPSGINTPQMKRLVQPVTPVRKTDFLSPVESPSPCYALSTSSATVQVNTLPASSSILNKSLSASKLQLRNLQRQLRVQPNVKKMAIYIPENTGNITCNITDTQTAVMRATRPDRIPQCTTNHASIQSGITPNKARIVASTPPRILMTAPLLSPKFQQKTVEPSLTDIAATRLNRMLHDVQLDVCMQSDDTKALTEGVDTTTSLHSVHVNSMQNHITTENMITDSDDNVFLDSERMEESSFRSDGEKVSVSSVDAVSLNNASLSTSYAAVTSVVTPTNSVARQSNFILCTESFDHEEICGLEPSSINSIIPTSTILAQSDMQLESSFSSTNLLASVLGELDYKAREVWKPQLEKDEIYKAAPWFIELLDKGKGPSAKEIFSVIQNGNKAVSSASDINLEERSSIMNTPVIRPILVTTPFTSNGDSLMQICTGQTTSCGDIGVQPDQERGVSLRIERSENSDQDLGLSPISGIAETLECVSGATSRTNAECDPQVPHAVSRETTATMIITTNTPTLIRPVSGQQIIIVSPSLSQPQFYTQVPNIKLPILPNIPKVEDSVNLIEILGNSLNQIQQPIVETPDIRFPTHAKWSLSDNLKLSTPESKTPCIDTKSPLLETTLTLSTSVPSSLTIGINIKPFQDNQPFLPKSAASMDSLSQTQKLTTAKAVSVPVQYVDFPSRREGNTSCSRSADHSRVSIAANISSKPHTSSKLEYICEWKDCKKTFSSPGAVFVHASKLHVPYCNDDMICLWKGCDSIKRKCFSLLVHLQDWHCNENMFRIQALRRKQVIQKGKTSVAPLQMLLSHPSYPPDAVSLAMRRYDYQYLNPKELSEDEESTLTKSIRLTSALILRNLAIHSSVARSYLKSKETDLAYLAMSPVESSKTIAECLSELARTLE